MYRSKNVKCIKEIWFYRLEDTKFQEKIKTAQINWIGKSTGAEVDFTIKGTDEKLTVYTTRPDTLYGVTFMVIAPEHPYIDLYSGLIHNMNEIIDYREKYPEASLLELSEIISYETGKPITKSGLNHRFRKIRELAEKIKK